MRRSTVPLTAVMISAAAIVLSSTTAAAAAEPEMLLSTDGKTFSAELPGGLFEADRLLVPGESISASLWITNASSLTAIVSVTAADVAVPPSWAGAATMSMWDSGTERTHSSAIEDLADCSVIVTSQRLEPGSSVRADIGFALGDPTDLVGQGERMQMNLKVALREAGGEAGAVPASGCFDDGTVVPIVAPDGSSAARGGTRDEPDRMADTGGEVPRHLVALGALALGSGLYLVVGRRRRRA